MGVFSKQKHSSRLYKVVKDAQRSEPMVTYGGKKQSKETARGARQYNPSLKRRSDQGLKVMSTIDLDIMRASGKGA